MTTRVTIKNQNQGAPYAKWSIEIVMDENNVLKELKPGEEFDIYLHEQSPAMFIREKNRGSS